MPSQAVKPYLREVLLMYAAIDSGLNVDYSVYDF